MCILPFFTLLYFSNNCVQPADPVIKDNNLGIGERRVFHILKKTHEFIPFVLTAHIQKYLHCLIPQFHPRNLVTALCECVHCAIHSEEISLGDEYHDR